MIRYLFHNEIDKERWDCCIAQSVTPYCYASSWYLDIVAPGWGALVSGDYNVVMPLYEKRKWGISYLFPPLFTKQLGLFSATSITPETVKAFIGALPRRIKLYYINLNEGNPVDALKGKVILTNNQTLDLNQDYLQLRKAYSKSVIPSVRKAQRAVLSVIPIDERVDEFMSFISCNLKMVFAQLPSYTPEITQQLIRAAINRGAGSLMGVFLPSGEMVACGFFLIDINRCISLFLSSTKRGKEIQAMHLLIDYMLQKYQKSNMVFDFHGSSLQGVAYFNHSFGARNQPFPVTLLNKLPWPLRLIKKLPGE